MTNALFDPALRALRRDRAARAGPALFLHERAFEDIVERLAVVRRRFASALLLGCPNPEWPERIAAIAQDVDVRDPGARFAEAAGGTIVDEEALDLGEARYDLCIAVGTLDTVNALPVALGAIRRALSPGGMIIGVVAGGDSLPRLRAAMRAADEVAGNAAPHVHPRIEPAALGPLLNAAGFVEPVVDVDRVAVSYRSLDALVADLRAMAATNILVQRPRFPLLRRHLAAARAVFDEGGRTEERFDLLHFAAWTPPQG